MHSRSTQTLTIEAMLKAGQSPSAVAREMGVSRQRIHSIKQRLCQQLVNSTEPVSGSGELSNGLPFKSLTIRITPAVHDALVEACEVTNRGCPEEPVTLAEYVEECVINRVAELGLLRKNKHSEKR